MAHTWHTTRHGAASVQIPFSKWWALALVVAVGIFVYCTVVGGAGWLIYATYLYFSRRKGKLDYVAQADVEFDADDDAVEMTGAA